jgi:P-type Mg2+ transporter
LLEIKFCRDKISQRGWIILALRHTRKNVVSYLEDGINDASALHAANASIVVDTVADIVREAAAFVLLEKDLVVLPKGVKEVGGGHLLDDDRYVHA